jgi:uncharacterized membrane protein YfcA
VPAPLLALPFGLAIGLSLGLVGGGGSILAVPVLVYVLGEGVREATTASLLIVGCTALAGALDHARAGRVRLRTAVAFGSSGAFGSLAGTLLNRVASPRAILFLFGLLLLAAAGAMLRRREDLDQPHEEQVHAWRRVLPLGLLVGVLTGFFGVGGGFLIVPALALVLGLPTSIAVGTSLLVIAIVCAVGFAAHLATGTIDWAVAGTFTAAGLVGAVIGSRLVERVRAIRLRQLFAAVTTAVALALIAVNANVLL